jgi:ABC-2 type transport system ATP-binding protein
MAAPRSLEPGGARAALAVHTRGLTLNYGSVRALDALDLDVPRGALFALLGPNGAGKSTTIAILTTMLAPSAGEAVVAGWSVSTQPRQVRRSLGVVFQDISLDDRLTARENLDLHAAMHGIPRGDRAKRVRAGLEAVGLASTANQRVRTLSGGMKRRLEIARALLHDPEIVILDEPTVGLDPQMRRAVWDHLASIAATHERTVFVTTHYMDEAERCDDVAIVDHGKLVARGAPAELVARTGGERLVVRCNDAARAADAARGLGWKVSPSENSPGRLVIEGQRPEAMLARLAQAGAGIEEAEIVRPTLEDVFVDLTGRGLRDVHDEEAGRHAAMRTNLRARGRR